MIARCPGWRRRFQTSSTCLVFALTLAVATQGCSAKRHTSPPYPAQGQSAEQRKADMADCDAWAKAETVAATDDGRRGIRTLGAVLVGGAIGAATGAATFGAAGGRGAAPAAAVGATLGAISGALAASTGESVEARQMTADGFRSCMIARGYVVESGMQSPVATNNLGSLGGVVGAVTSGW